MRHRFVHEWFAATALRLPDRVAIAAPEGSISYAELCRRATALADVLTDAGVDHGDVVALFVEDRATLVASIIAVLNAGGAFVPLPPHLPGPALRAMLDGCAARWAVVEPAASDRFSALCEERGATFERIFAGDVIVARAASERSADTRSARRRSGSDDLAYIFFTSGSTERPKAIAGRLCAIDHFIRWEIDTFGLDADVRVSQLISPTFDACLRDIFVPLCVGGTLCVPDDAALILDPDRLAAWVEARGISLIHSVPSVFRAVLAHVDGQARMPSLRLVFLSGEPLLPADATRWYAAFGERTALVNLYGPSETTMTKLFHRVQPADREGTRVPIGTPMRGAAALLIDDFGQVCPPGAVGELYIRTPYRSLGYYRQPDLTAQVFVQNPFNPDPSDVVYRTGDLARTRDDGAFEFLGRRDRQVKVRGVRVELDQIENALRECDGMVNGAVVQRDDRGDDPYLCAYVVLRAGTSALDVQRRLTKVLPSHMVPAVFAPLDRLPLTPNGKLDVRALPPPDLPIATPGGAPPRTPVEEIVAGTFGQVLGRAHVGRDDDFFALGGHSLLATQVMARLRTALGVELPARAMFEAPTAGSLAAVVTDQLSATPLRVAPPAPVPRQAALPLSFTQQRLWFIDQLEPGRSTYNSAKAVRLRGGLDVPALRATLSEIVRRHEVLRTCFPSQEGKPVQVMLPPMPVALPLIDLRQCSAAARVPLARRAVRAAATRPFELSRDLLVRAHLVRLDAHDHVLLLTLHHIVSDAWSIGILIRELSALYAAACTGAPTPLPELPIQYADFAVWQRAHLDEQVLSEQLQYWREQLEGVPVLDLPTDRPRPAVADDTGARLTWTVPPDVVAHLHQVRQRQGVTLFMTLLAAFDVLLARYAGQTDIAVGIQTANRRHVETEDLVGCFVNQLVLRTDVSGNPSFGQLLGRVREMALGAYAHQDLPFEKLVEALAPQRYLRRAPLFQVELLHQNVPRAPLALRDVEVDAFDAGAVSARFELTLSVDEHEDGLHGTLDYSAALYERPTMARLLEHYVRLLGAAVADLTRPVLSLPLLGQEERRQIVTEWNHTAVVRDAPSSAVHDVVTARALHTPDAVAVVDASSHHLSYATLNERAAQLANYLHTMGVGPEVKVGLCLRRTAELPVALMGILQAGAAYVPLDATYPALRLSMMLEDAQAAVVVTETELADALPATWAQIVCVDRDADAIAGCTSGGPPVDVAGGALAYVIYTSGSTGRPKGVMITHEGLINYLRWAIAAYDADAGDGSPVHSSVSFDLTVTSIMPALMSGKPLVLLPDANSLEGLAGSGTGLRTFTLVKLTPAHLRSLADLMSASRAATFTHLFVVGGEALRGDVVKFWRTCHPDLRVVNEYGPTETVVGCCVYDVPRGQVPDGALPIGRPIANTQLYALDGETEPAPIGVPGELFIGGVGVARGYLGQPALTAEKFVPDPFGSTSGARLYRTGDRVRWRRDGELEFLGRLDNQVKLRGHRIELGEIEHALSSHPLVNETAVILREDAPGDIRLVAYLATAAGTVDETVWREFLENRLPAHMVPSAFVTLDRFPLNANGKLDRRALPSPRDTRPAPNVAVAWTPTEGIVAGIWTEVLRVERIARADDFFALGGHSLLATQVIARIRAALEVELPLRALFETPTVSGIAAAVDAARRGTPAVLAPPVVAADRARPLPLSFAQQRLWFLAQLEPHSAAYNVPVALRLSGPLDAGALRAALGELIQRHAVLRTTYRVADDGEPVQVIAPAAAAQLPIVDLTGVDDGVRRVLARRVRRVEAARPFDLAAGPVVRTMLVRLGPTEALGLITLHHIATDAWSTEVIVREVSAFYASRRRGTAAALPGLAVQYADYAAWQRRWLTGPVLEQQVAHWRRRLAGAPAVLGLPVDRPRASVAGDRGGRTILALDPALASGLRAVSRRAGVTAYMTFLAACNALLARHGAGDDIVVGTPVGGRTRLETEPLVGLFVNTLVIRTNLSGDPTIADLLAQVRAAVLDAHAHQDVPFEHLVDALGADRSLAHTPLFNVLVTFAEASRGAASLYLGDVEVASVPPVDVAAKFDLQVDLEDRGDQISGALTYRAELFDRSTIERLARHLVRVLEQCAADPALRVSSIEVLDAAERRQILETWNDTSRALGTDTCLHTLVEMQAHRTPDAVAVVCESAHLSYSALRERAARLAVRLRREAIAPDDCVAICADRSLALVVGMLGVLVAGAAYVPLDPSYPEARLAYMLEDSGARALLIQARQRRKLPLQAPPIVYLDSLEEPNVPSAFARDSAAPVTPGNLAYTIYTSGSTGRAKGAMNSHRAIVNRLVWMQQQYRLGPDDAVLHKTPISFDVSVWEFFWPLIVGARLVVARPEGHRDPMYLTEAIERQHVTTLHFVPPMLRAFLEAGEPARCGCVRRVICSGEALGRDLVERALDALPGVDLQNLYGPTEAAIDVTFHACSHGSGVVPIGRPVANTRTYVLDRSGAPVPAGVPGELHLGGVQVGRGYLGRPALTAERFVPDAFSAEPGARLYRTGDRARWLAHGELAYLGRFDFQVKVRGHRIEPGEIEHVLTEHPAVRGAVVVARPDLPDRGLVAYVVAADGATPRLADLTAHVRERLPEYLVPEAFVLLDDLPLTPNGKVNRQALPVPVGPAVSTDAPPRTAVEELLAAIWSDLLGVEPVGTTDSFFALGGHSLLATRVVSRVRHAFGVDLPLRAIFEAPTVRALAARVDALRTGHAVVHVPSVARRARTASAPLSFAQQRLWFLHALDPLSASYHVARAVRLGGAVSTASLRAALTEILRRHEVVRTSFVAHDGEPVQIVTVSRPAALPVIDLTACPAAARQRLAERLASDESARPFDLTQGPLLRARLLRLEAREHVLLLTVHHIVSDGWSMDILFAELMTLYDAASARTSSPLAELPLQYADFAAWQRDVLRDGILDEHLRFWREELLGVPILALPTDWPRPPIASTRGADVSFALSADVVSGLRRVSRTHHATTFMALHAAFQVLLGRYAGQTDVPLGIPVSNRTQVELERLIGCFVNTLVLRTRWAGRVSFAVLLAQVRETLLNAHAHQDLPFERLVDELMPARDLSRAPLFQVMFAFQNTPGHPSRTGGLQTAPFVASTRAAAFDLSLFMWEDDDRLQGRVAYATDLFARETVQRLVGHFCTMVAAIASGAEQQAVGELNLLSEVERHSLTRGVNTTRAPWPAAGVHQLIRRQAAATPDAIAIEADEGQLTYRALARRTARVRERLRGLALMPEEPVGVSVDRSLDLVPTLLGVLEAGGAYVPLDATYPTARLACMIADAGLRVLLTDTRERARVAAAVPDGCTILMVDEPWADAASVLDSADRFHADWLAYVIYTSGSTGRPKGVAVAHGGLTNFLTAMQASLDVTARDRLVAVTTVSFDIAALELFVPLVSGARVLLASRDTVTMPHALASLIATRGASLLQATPTTWQQLCALDWQPPADFQVLCGGEALRPELAAALCARGTRVWNLYGPTETTIWSMTARLRRTDTDVPLGVPLANTEVYVLDAEGALAPTTVIGELFIGGAGVARGYLGAPRLTAERFVPDPWGARPGARLYRTGDRVRWRAPGRLEFLGRLDSQIKLHGYRIDLREVEAVLDAHAGVRQSVVVIREDAGGDARLVAYVVHAGRAPSWDLLRRDLLERLPAYMVPAAFVALDTLPLTPNGKVDRQALPAPEWRAEAVYVAPRTATEHLLAAVWRDVLGLEQVGVRDNFFALGGDSLLSIRVVARANEQGLRLVPRHIFEHQTIEELASVADVCGAPAAIPA